MSGPLSYAAEFSSGCHHWLRPLIRIVTVQTQISCYQQGMDVTAHPWVSCPSVVKWLLPGCSFNLRLHRAHQWVLKDTVRKPLGHLHLGVTHTTMSSVSSAVETLTQVKAWTSIMAVDVNCWSFGFISQLEYSWVVYHMYGHRSSLRKGLLTKPVDSGHCLYSDFTACKLHSEHQRESRDTLEHWPWMPFTSLSDDHVKNASSIYQQLELQWLAAHWPLPK
jgi:hypothetical protein